MRSEGTAGYCPECGAIQRDGMTCRFYLGALTTLEYRDPELQGQHFLTVASFNLQHPAAFTEEAIDDLRDLFIRYLDEDLPLSEIRARVSAAAEGRRRVRRRIAEQETVPRYWKMTIADVYLTGEPGCAAERVRQWSASIRAEL